MEVFLNLPPLDYGQQCSLHRIKSLALPAISNKTMGGDLQIRMGESVLAMRSNTMASVYHLKKNFMVILDQNAIAKNFLFHETDWSGTRMELKMEEDTGVGIHGERSRKDPGWMMIELTVSNPNYTPYYNSCTKITWEPIKTSLNRS